MGNVKQIVFCDFDSTISFMALETSVVFAGDGLAQYLDERQKSDIPRNDFLVMRHYLGRLWK